MAEILSGFETPLLQSAIGDVSCLSHSYRPTTHLPKLHLPTFDGSIDKWENFRDRFTSLIRNDQSLSSVNRMHYLSSCVKGEAINALSHLAITDANFAVAWDILVARYDNKRRLINYHFQSLLNLPTVSTNTSKDLCALSDISNAAIQGLRNLGRPVEHLSDMLVFLISQKLDKISREAWELRRDTSEPYPTFAEINQFLNERIQAFGTIIPIKPKEKSTDTTKSAKNNTVASHAASTVSFKCPVCKQGTHLLYQCETFLNKTPIQRSEYIRQNNRCLNCFSRKHHVKNCTNSHVCKYCNAQHHSLLHYNVTANPSTSEQSEAPATTSEVATHFVSKTVSPNSIGLLATARLRLHSPHGRMGDLPEARVNRVSRAFIHSGVDYAGPIALRSAPGRGHKSHKVYIALFICLTTKAIHLELVSDYSAATFRAAYHRFISRRGLPKTMYLAERFTNDH
ncbi:hypothetical protein ALC62_01007 [Cyphomyrmex costatus]|uniref:Peptidase aspartic putative domain-containing protein n=1 Tax=Cyphomyrmex costatus TaxID=456900 RepID=A0A151IPR8_9HYME|nr:hypothetical protein ALC62_01007 [Cyphomyrmex costatus]